MRREITSPPFLAVGTGRCGSTLFSALMRRHPDVLSLSEFFTVLGGRRALEGQPLDGGAFFARLRRAPPDMAALLYCGRTIPEVLATPAASPHGAPIDPLRLIPLPHLGGDPEEILTHLECALAARGVASVGAHHAFTFATLAKAYEKRCFIERSGGSLEYLPELLRTFPTAHVVHIYRDPRDCALSMARHPFFRVRVARRADPQASVDAAIARDLPLERFGAYWSAVTVRGVRALRQIAPARVLHVSTATLAAHPERELQRVFSFMGQPPLDAPAMREVLSLTRGVPPRWPHLSAPSRRALESSCELGVRALRSIGVAIDLGGTTPGTGTISGS